MLLPLLLLILSGCWDNHELDTLFIVTGVGLDEAGSPDEIDVTLQIGKAKKNKSESSSKEQKDSSIILMETTSDSLMHALMDLNRNSSRTLFLQHNQAILFGQKLAEQGVSDKIDYMIRNTESRMETLLLVVEGRTGEVLSMQPDQGDNWVIYISAHVRQYTVSTALP